MKLYLNEGAKAYLEDLLNTQDDGRYLSEVMNAYLSSLHGEEEATIKEAISKAKSEPDGIRAGYLDFLGGEDPDFLEIAPKYRLGEFLSLHARKFRDNPYFKLLRGVKDHVKDVTLNWLSYAPYELFLSNEIHAEGDIMIDQVVIGSCTNGRIEDMRIAAGIMKGRKIADWLRVIIIPGTQQVYLQMIREGLAEIFVEAGAIVSTPTCGPCLGGHMGILAHGEKAVSTTNRNFVGRMGAIDSEIYLASPAVAAASAILGKIASPEDL
jgi:homoaconitase/3-isopropylmalate dehydratase large subunit